MHVEQRTMVQQHWHRNSCKLWCTVNYVYPSITVYSHQLFAARPLGLQAGEQMLFFLPCSKDEHHMHLHVVPCAGIRWQIRPQVTQLYRYKLRDTAISQFFTSPNSYHVHNMARDCH